MEKKEIELIKGDNLCLLKDLKNNSVDSIVTDPPYGLSFMNKKWDHDVPTVELWKEVLRVLKPGGHVLSFGGTRTYHRMAVNIEDAGFEIRDQIMWLYGSGFPKSHNISKAIDKKLGAKREVVKTIKKTPSAHSENMHEGYKRPWAKDAPKTMDITAPASNLAKKWDGYGTALKPANEPIVLARKPLSEKTIVDNVLKWGVGCINIDECRVEAGLDHKKNCDRSGGTRVGFMVSELKTEAHPQGRFPANVILDEEAGAVLDKQSGQSKSSAAIRNNSASENLAMSGNNLGHISKGHSDSGGASRFFYCPKASKKERNAGLEKLDLNQKYSLKKSKSSSHDCFTKGKKNPCIPQQNFHPTVKPIKLMEYLIKLVTPKGGTVLDPYMGSGSTGVAAKNLGFDFIGMELNKEYFEIADKRIKSNDLRNLP